MKRLSYIAIVILLVIMVLPIQTTDNPSSSRVSNVAGIRNQGGYQLSSAGGEGNTATATAYFKHNVTNQEAVLYNTYGDTSTHHSEISLAPYHITGWTLYRVEVNMNDMMAVPERAVTATGSTLNSFLIEKYLSSPDYYYDILAQGFSSPNFDAQLLNYTVYYYTDTGGWAMSDYGTLNLEIREDNENATTAITTPVSLSEKASRTWVTVATSTNLTAATEYYAVMDGTGLSDFSGSFPNIYWQAEAGGGSYKSARHDTFDDSWATRPYEAYLNYTYLPWNMTTNSVLHFNTPEQIGLQVNSTDPIGGTWDVESATNIQSITFDSSQSTQLDYNLTLWFKKTETTTNSWNIATSGGTTIWNSTTSISYPKVIHATSKYLNLTKISDWAVTGFYNGSSSTDYSGNTVSYPLSVVCSTMTNGTWTLQSSADNYVATLTTLDSSDSSLLTSNVSINTDVDVISLIRDTLGNNATTGTTNLTIWEGVTLTWADSINQAVSNGVTQHLWDVSTDTPDNVRYRLEIFWTNGTEAGYRTKEMVVWYPTTLTPQQPIMSDFTNDNFEIRVDFIETFYSTGLDLANSTVNCSLSGGYSYDFDLLMDDGYGNGTWTKAISTAGWEPGTYVINIDARGFALENMSTTVTVSLVHDTDPLTIQWTAGTNISYVESTVLKVTYENATGSIPGATVNVTIGATPYVLAWNLSTGTYDYTFYGNNPHGFDTHALFISAWKQGYEIQTDSTESLTIHLDSPTLTPNWFTQTLNWTEQSVLSIEYRDSLGSLISNPDLKNVSIDGIHYPLSGVAGIYTVMINNTWDLGYHNVNVFFSKFGYVDRSILTINFTIIKSNTTLELIWTSTEIDYLGQIDLTANYYEIGSGTAVPITIPMYANITIDGLTTLPLNISGSQWTANFTGIYLDLGPHNVEISFWEYGYVSRYELRILTITEANTTLAIIWSESPIDYLGQFDLTANYSYDGDGHPVAASTAELVIDGGSPISLTPSGNLWIANLSGLFLDLGPHNVLVRFSEYGHEYQENTTILMVNNVTTFLSVVWTPANLTIDYTGSFDVVVEYTFWGGDVPFASTNVNVTINGLLTELAYITGAWRGTITGDDIGVGFHTAVIDAWSYGYQWNTTIVPNVNVTLAANSFLVGWNGGGVWNNRNITYIEMLYINVTYTHDYTPVLGATVNITFNGIDYYDLTYNVVSTYYEISIPGYVIDVGVWNATITAWSPGFDKGAGWEWVSVENDDPIITPSWTTNSTDYVTSKTITIMVTASNFSLLTDCDISYDVSGQNGNGSAISDGIYEMTLGPLSNLGNQTVTITMSKHGYSTTIHLVYINVIETESQLVGTPPDSTRYYDQNLAVDIYYEMWNSTVIDGASASLWINAIPRSITWASDHWHAIIQSSDFGVGIQTCYIDIFAYGFESQNYTFTLTVLAIPVDIVFPAGNQVYVNDSLQIIFSYLDTRTSGGIIGDSLNISWESNNYDLVMISPGQYNLTIYTEAVHVGTYNLEAFVTTIGHLDITENMSIVVNPILTELIFIPQQVEQYENESVRFTVQLNDTIHNLFIGNSNVTLMFEGTYYNMTYLPGSMTYVIDIRLDNIIPGSYQVQVIANTTDATDADGIIELGVLAKLDYSLTLTLSEQVTAGGDLVATVEVKRGDDLVVGKQISFQATFIIRESARENSTEVRTLSAFSNTEGIAVVNFEVPVEAIEVAVWAEFTGSVSEWARVTGQVVREINPPADLLSLILQIFMRSDIQVLIVVIVMLGIVGAAYSKRVRPKKRERLDELNSQLKEFESLNAVKHFMAVYLEQGTCVFYHPFAEGRIEPDLISGFIAAITSVYGEIKGDGVKGTLEEIHYQGLRLNSYSGNYIVGILILEGDITKLLRERLQVFVELFESQYADDLEGWVGHYGCFEPQWVVSHLNDTIHYSWHLPHSVSTKKSLSKSEERLVEIISRNFDENKEFRIRDAIDPISEELGIPRAASLHYLLRLRRDGLINPISTQEVLARQGFGLAGDKRDIGSIMERIPPAKVKEEVDDEESDADTDEEIEWESPQEAEEGIDAEVQVTEEPEPVEEEPEALAPEEDTTTVESEEVIAEEKEPEEPKDELEDFVKDVEALLTKEEKEKSKDKSD